MRVAVLGPAGTFSEEAALQSGFAGEKPDLDYFETIPQAIESVASGSAGAAMVPLENSIEGSVHATMDSLLEQAGSVTIGGEWKHPIRLALIARDQVPLDSIESVLSHPQPLAQCARFLSERLPGASLEVATSTSAAIRRVAESDSTTAALGPATAAPLYGCTVVEPDVEDQPGNVTRFVWIVPSGESVVPAGSPGGWKTTLVFAELGADHPGALVDALVEFSTRDINLVKIESRPQKRELGRYLFYVDVEGRDTDPVVEEALSGLSEKAAMVTVLGSYPAAD